MNKILLIVSVFAFIVLLMMMFLTSPSQVGPVGVLVFFTISYLFFLGLAVLGCKLFFLLRGKLNRAKAVGNIEKKSLRYGMVVAIAPVALLLAGSLSGITIWEVLLVGVLEILLCFLTSRNVI
jgi:hypothetical protein